MLTISRDRIRFLNERGQFERIPYISNGEEMEVIMDQELEPPTDLFKNPFVVEVVGGGFVKPAKITYHTLRFPRITKIHEDRSCSDIVSFDGLQRLSQEDQSMGEDADSQGDRGWIVSDIIYVSAAIRAAVLLVQQIERLVQTDPRSKFIDRNSANASPGRDLDSASTASPTSIAHCLPVLPSLVRIDTQELTEQKRGERALLNGGLDSSPARSRRIYSANRKRKLHEHNSNVVTPSKRYKSSNQQITGDNIVESREERPDSRSHRALLRQPLVPIPNPSAALKCRPCELAVRIKWRQAKIKLSRAQFIHYNAMKEAILPG